MFDLTVWQWWLAAGFLLLIAEIFAPGVFMIWFGVAAVILGLITWLIPALPWALQAVLFASLSVAFVLYYRHLKAKYNTEGSDQPLLNKPLAQMIGQVHALHTAIENGRGKIKIGDSLWSVRGPDMPAGERVRILAVQDLVLEVEAAG
ncbi:MAG: NfeD family protein [Xanthomonadales bacterium]|nr:NfeD family protein [Xanthomonadales bacterium]